MRFIAKLTVAFLAFWLGPTVAQEGYFGQGHENWHQGFYRNLERPDNKASCCNQTDCRPTSGRQVDGQDRQKQPADGGGGPGSCRAPEELRREASAMSSAMSQAPSYLYCLAAVSVTFVGFSSLVIGGGQAWPVCGGADPDRDCRTARERPKPTVHAQERAPALNMFLNMLRARH